MPLKMEVFRHTPVFIQRTCHVCGRKFIRERAWRVLIGHREYHVCSLHGKTHQHIRDKMEQHVPGKKPIAPPPPARHAKPPRTVGDLLREQKECQNKGYLRGDVAHIGFGIVPGKSDKTTLMINLEADASLEELITKLPQGTVAIIHIRDGKLKSISFGD